MVEGYGELLETIEVVGCRGLLLANCALNETKLNLLSNRCDSGIKVRILNVRFYVKDGSLLSYI